MSKLALKLIEENKKTKSKILDLGNCGLTSIPDEVLSNTWLEVLIMSNEYFDYEKMEKVKSKNTESKNIITYISITITLLQNLKKLILAGSPYEKWNLVGVSRISELNYLEYLDLSHNRIEHIERFEGLQHLRTLSLKDNLLVNVSNLSKNLSLETLDISRNKITDFSFLNPFNKIKYLYISNNPINANEKDYIWTSSLEYIEANNCINFPIRYLAICKSLKTAYLNSTNLSDISFLMNCEKLETLAMDYNPAIYDYSPLKVLLNLKELSLEQNDIIDISFLSFLSNLEYLNLNNNKIIDLESVSSLTSLIKLHLAFNEISDASSLRYLINLKVLNLTNNRIVDISFINRLINLYGLSLDNNLIIDAEIISRQNNLVFLSLSKNSLISISFLFKLKAIEIIYLDNNQISVLPNGKMPSTLSHIYLHGNRISEIEGNHVFLKPDSKITVDLSENPILDDFPKEVVEAGWFAIRDRLIAVKVEEKFIEIKDVKMLLLGNTNVGKSNLLQYFERGDEPSINSSTHGIQYKELTKLFGSDAIVHCWDFGGQEYFHATHQLFFSPGALHIVLWSEKNVQRSNDQLEECFDLTYWLRSIEQLIGNFSNESQDKTDVIICENKIDLKNYKPTNLNQLHFENRFKELELCFCAINLKPLKYLEGFKEMVKEKFSSLYNKYSLSYAKYLKKIKSARKKFMLIKDIDPENIEKVKTAVSVFHNMGILLYFGNIIPDKIFTKPQALLTLLYEGILSKEQKERISISEIETAVRNNDLNLSCKEVLDLLIHFDLIFQIPSNRDTYFIPQYLKAPSSLISFFETYQFKKPNIIIESDSYLMNLAMLKMFSKFGQYVKGNEKNAYLFWKDGIVIEKNNQILLVKLNRKMQRLELYPDVQNKNFELQNEVVDFILQIPLKLNKNIGSMQFPGIESESARTSLLNWKNENFKIYISLDGEFFIEWNELISNVDKGFFQVQSIRKNIENETVELKERKQLISVFEYNKYLPNNKKGQMKKIFISYSKDDLKMVNKFIEHLSALQLDGKVSHWYCTELTAGGDWNYDIQKHFDEADIVCFMVSPNFMRTKYIHEHEIKKAFERKELQSNFKIVPVILDFCKWATIKNNLATYTALPYTAKPIADFENENMAWYIVQECLRIMIEKDINPSSDDFYMSGDLPKDVLSIFKRIIDGKVDKSS